MRFNEFKDKRVDEEQLDEIIPAIAGIARGAATLGAKAAGGIAKAGAKVGAAAAKKVGASAVAGAQGAGKGLAAKIANKNAKTLQKSILKKGLALPIPDFKGKAQQFKIDDVKGDEVTLTNPKPKPGEPIKTVHKKKELDSVIQGLVK